MAETGVASEAASADSNRQTRNQAQARTQAQVRTQSGLPLHSGRVLAGILALSATNIMAEIYLPVGVWAAALHLSLVFLGVWLARPRDVYVLAAITSGLTALGAVLTSGAASATALIQMLVSGPGLANRLIVLLAIWALAAALAESKRRESRLRNRLAMEAARRQAAETNLEQHHSVPRPSALDERVREPQDMGHEIRTLLNAIVGFSAAAKSEIFGPIEDKRYRDYLSHINESGWALLRVFEGFLASEPLASKEADDGARRTQGGPDSPSGETTPAPAGKTTPASAVS